MQKKKLLFQMIAILVLMFILALSIITSTYAWFTNNRIVYTDSAAAKSASERVELQISRFMDSGFVVDEAVELVPASDAWLGELLPVSTSDLQHFVLGNSNENEHVVFFTRLTTEACYFHARIYLRAVSEGASPNDRMALYLDAPAEGTGNLLEATNQGVINAARLGFIINGGSPVILRFNDEKNEDGTVQEPIYINDVPLEGNQIIDSSQDIMAAVADPSGLISDFMVEDYDTVPSKQPLAYMELNQAVPVDIYFYLEGCDSECTDALQKKEMDLQLSFYGVLMQEGS